MTSTAIRNRYAAGLVVEESARVEKAECVPILTQQKHDQRLQYYAGPTRHITHTADITSFSIAIDLLTNVLLHRIMNPT